MRQADKIALQDWAKFKDDISRSTPVDRTMTHAEREKHRVYLEARPIEWIKFFCAPYVKSEFAAFHRRAIRRIIANDEWFEVLSWSRELAKSTVTMCVILYLVLTGRKRNVILTSNSKDNAVRLLAPYRAMLEANGRIIVYYGQQMTPGSWTEDEFLTKGAQHSVPSAPGSLPVDRATRRHALTCCSWMISTPTRTARTPTSSRSGGSGGRRLFIPHDPSPPHADRVLRQHHRERLLRGPRRRHGRPLGYCQHTRQGGQVNLAGEKTRRSLSTAPSRRFPPRRRRGVFQQPHIRRGSVRVCDIWQGALS